MEPPTSTASNATTRLIDSLYHTPQIRACAYARTNNTLSKVIKIAPPANKIAATARDLPQPSAQNASITPNNSTAVALIPPARGLVCPKLLSFWMSQK